MADAVRWLEQARALQPQDAATLVWLGDAYLSQGQPEKATPLFASALSTAEGSAAHYGAGRAALSRR